MAIFSSRSAALGYFALGAPVTLATPGCSAASPQIYFLLGQLAHDAAKVGAVVRGDLLLEVRRHARAVGSGDGAAAVGGATVHLVVVEEVGGGIAEGNL